MTYRINGTFTVKLSPQTDEIFVNTTMGRATLDKQFHGALEAVSQGQMLSALTDVKGSAGYVAIEKVSGTLQGRRGSFVLQHSSTMKRGVPQQTIMVTPDSGTDELIGLQGSMTITITEGKHFYDFEYSFAE